jgi:hypothetical protein
MRLGLGPNIDLCADISGCADFFIGEDETGGDDGVVVVDMLSHISESGESAKDQRSRSSEGLTLPLLGPRPTCVWRGWRRCLSLTQMHRASCGCGKQCVFSDRHFQSY